LAVTIPLADPDAAIRVVLEEKQVQYYLVKHGELLRADPHEERVDRAVYLLLAELAARTE
jgi:hypothetical protein